MSEIGSPGKGEGEEWERAARPIARMRQPFSFVGGESADRPHRFQQALFLARPFERESNVNFHGRTHESSHGSEKIRAG